MIPRFRLEDACVSVNARGNPVIQSVFKVDNTKERYTISPTEDCCFGRNPPLPKETQEDLPAHIRVYAKAA